MFRLPRKESASRGMTATTRMVGAIRAMGAALKTQRSASAGTTSSLVSSLIPSAMGWNMPKGPHLLGPSLA